MSASSCTTVAAVESDGSPRSWAAAPSATDINPHLRNTKAVTSAPAAPIGCPGSAPGGDAAHSDPPGDTGLHVGINHGPADGACFVRPPPSRQYNPTDTDYNSFGHA